MEVSRDALNRNLVHAGLILVAFELVKALVIKPVKYIYEGMTFGEGLPFKSYQDDVLVRHKHVFEASLLYLRDHFGAISSEDINAIQSLRDYRNCIAHQLSELLPGMDADTNNAMLARAREALFRLSNFWVYMDVGADPRFQAMNIDWSKAIGREMILLDEIIERSQHLEVGKANPEMPLQNF